MHVMNGYRHTIDIKLTSFSNASQENLLIICHGTFNMGVKCLKFIADYVESKCPVFNVKCNTIAVPASLNKEKIRLIFMNKHT